MEMNWAKANMARKVKLRKIINMKELKERTENAGLKEIVQGQGNIRTQYTEWQKKLHKIIESCSRMQKKKTKKEN